MKYRHWTELPLGLSRSETNWNSIETMRLAIYAIAKLIHWDSHLNILIPSDAAARNILNSLDPIKGKRLIHRRIVKRRNLFELQRIHAGIV